VIPTRIVVADSLTVFRAAVRNLLEREEDFEVAEASDLAELERSVEERVPDIALVDLQLPPLGGVAAVRAVRERCAACVIVWSLQPGRQNVFEAIRAGAAGYLHKEISAQGLVRSLRGVAHGEAALPRDLTAVLVATMQQHERDRDVVERAGRLSAREREVLDHVVRGAGNRQIAQALAISEFTVKRHVQNILRKLDLSSRRAAAALYAGTFVLEEDA
jgi:two-component system nitrate/nitrite response regulator NarL